MSERSSWTGSAADLLRVSVERSSDRIPKDGIGWAKNPRALAGHLRRAQTFLRALGICERPHFSQGSFLPVPRQLLRLPVGDGTWGVEAIRFTGPADRQSKQLDAISSCIRSL